MVDWGILAFFVVQLGITFAVYHALGGVKAEKSVLLSESERLRLASNKIDAVASRMDMVEKAPAERMKRLDAFVDDLAEKDRLIAKATKAIEAVDFKVHSLNGRIANNAKAAKRAAMKSDEEQDPDPQGEDEDHANAPQSPGSFPLRVESPQGPVIPRSFGQMRRAG